MATGSDVVITVAGVDITRDVIFSSATFESQMAAIPGQHSIIVKDPNRTYDFVTGDEITLDIDGTRVYGGWTLQPQKIYAFPADRTDDLSKVKSRQWHLQGPDYNYLLDKRVLRDLVKPTSNENLAIAGSIGNGAVVRTKFPTFFDIPAGFDFTSSTRITDSYTFPNGYIFPTQGSTMRENLDALAGLYGAVYYIDPNKQLRFIPVQNTAAPWGFSDVPNKQPIGWGGGMPTVGFREGSATEDGTPVANDALVWGGSQWAVNGDVVFARRENATSIAAHQRWQHSEVRVGEDRFKSQRQVDERARIIVDGNVTGVYEFGSTGLVNPEQQANLKWFSHLVPLSGGIRRHLNAGEVVTIELQTFGVTYTLPIRQVRITFPTLDAKTSPSKAYVEFEGFFGVLMSDPFWLWAFLKQGQPVHNIALTATDTSTAPQHGSLYQGVPLSVSGSTQTFAIPFPYINGTFRLYENGLLKAPGVYFFESNPTLGQIHTFAPVSGSLYAEAVTRGGTV